MIIILHSLVTYSPSFNFFTILKKLNLKMQTLFHKHSKGKLIKFIWFVFLHLNTSYLKIYSFKILKIFKFTLFGFSSSHFLIKINFRKFMILLIPNEILSKFVINFLKIKFDCHKSFLPFFFLIEWIISLTTIILS